MAMDTTPGTITAPQRNLIEKLLDTKAHDMDAAVDTIKAHLGEMSKQSGSDMITALLAYADKATTSAPQADNYGIPSVDDLPAGHYAVDNADGELTFYEVWRGTRKPEYVKLYVLHGPDSTEVPFGKGMVTILKSIASNAGAAAVRYGHEIGACSICNKRLTNRVSRALGIGPICGGRFWGEEFKSVVHGARQAIKAQGLDPDENVEEDEDVIHYDINGDFEPREGGDKWEIEEEMLDTPPANSVADGRGGWVISESHGPAVKSEGAWNILKAAIPTMSDEDLDSYIALLTREQTERAAKNTPAQDTSFLGR